MPAIELHQLPGGLYVCVVPTALAPSLLVGSDVGGELPGTMRRRGQFVVGREAARLAMKALGAEHKGIGIGTEGEPLFPAGVRGSISHTHRHSLAVVGWERAYRAIGIDIDDARPLGDAAAGGVTWKTEVKRIQRAMELGAPSAQNFAFSAKEAIFKCQYPLTLNASLTALQARLLPAEDEPSVCLRVAGWRVNVKTSQVLSAIVVSRQVLAAGVLALATIAEPCSNA